MRMLLMLSLLMAGPQCAAAKLFECRDAEGRVSFQDHGCRDQGRQREIEIDAPAPAPARKPTDHDLRQIAAWEKASRARLPPSLGGSTRAGGRLSRRRPASGAARPDACESARDEQARALRERSFELGFDQRRRLSDAVLNACGLH